MLKIRGKKMMIRTIGNLKFENKIIGFLLMDEKGNIKIKITKNISRVILQENSIIEVSMND